MRNGYDNTTVDQIAAAADVSPRTFSRYFPTKESVIAALATDVDQWVAEALVQQPLDISEHQALLAADVEIFRPDGLHAPAAFNRMAVLIQIVNASPTLRGATFAFQLGYANKSTTVIGERMGLPPEHPAVRLVADAWTTVCASAIDGMGTPGGDPLEANVMRNRLTSTFEVFRRTWVPWRNGHCQTGQPPAGEPSD